MRLTLFIFSLLFISMIGISSPAYVLKEKYVKAYLSAEPEDSIAKNKFIKKLVDSFRFRKNLQQREKKRVLAIINNLLLKSPRPLTEEYLNQLNKELEDKEKRHYDSVLAIINGLAAKIDKLPEVADDKNNLDQHISEEELTNLVNKLSPVLFEKAKEEKAEEEQQKKLKQIRFLLSKGGSIRDTLIVSDSILKTYSLRLRKKAEVFGFNPYWVKERYLNYNFNLISTLVFYGYELDYKNGNYISLNGWESSTVVDLAKKAGCNVSLAVFINNTEDISKFLKNEEAQIRLALTVVMLLKKRQTKGAHVIVENLSNADKDRFVAFIRNFSKTLKASDSTYTLTITVPVIDENLAYKINDLDAYVEKFVIDFSKKNERYPGPLAPLKGGNNSIVSGISFYANKNIPSFKFIASMPYRGARWSKTSHEFIDYINYNDIKYTYKDNPAVYDNSSTVRMDLISDGDTTEQLWYDDEATLAKKYDYLLENGVGGIGIWALGYDDGCSELWNLLMEKFISVDTFDIKLVKILIPKKTARSFWDKVKREFEGYNLILSHPCDYDPEEFKSDNYITYVTLFFLIIFVGVGSVYVHNIRNRGDSWKWRKAILRLLIFLILMVITTTFLDFFLSKNIPMIGINNGAPCNPMPFSSLISIISIGFILGLLVMRFLIVPLLKRDDTP